jgi:predicted extracellular nuclease
MAKKPMLMKIEGTGLSSSSDSSLERENEKNNTVGSLKVGSLNTQNYLNKESKEPYT